MPSKDPDTRILVAKIAAATRWGRSGSAENRSAATQAARRGLWAKFYEEADPDGVLDPAEREARAEQLYRAHMLRMSAAAKKALVRGKIKNLHTELADLETASEGGGDAA